MEIGEHGYWTGPLGASGILAVCTTTKRICLAMRSDEVQHGNCFGVLGGAVAPELTPHDSAVAELREETGYTGPVDLIPAYVFRKSGFIYRNYIGLVPVEFEFNAEDAHSWETRFIEWKTYPEIVQEMESDPWMYHFGAIALFENSGDLIRRYVLG